MGEEEKKAERKKEKKVKRKERERESEKEIKLQDERTFITQLLLETRNNGLNYFFHSFYLSTLSFPLYLSLSALSFSLSLSYQKDGGVENERKVSNK